MSLVLVKNVQKFMSNDKLSHNAKYYSLVYLSQMDIIQSKDFLEHSLKFFFDLFSSYTNENKDKEEEFFKYLSLIVKRINFLCKFSAEKVYIIYNIIEYRRERVNQPEDRNTIQALAF